MILSEYDLSIIHLNKIYKVKVIAPIGILFPSNINVGFGPACGAGDGLSEKLIPETIYGLNITPACYIHDEMWRLANNTKEDFMLSNSVFLHNILTIINCINSNPLMQTIRSYRAMTYYNCVSTIGYKIFEEFKK
jgi:hypothetical protein